MPDSEATDDSDTDLGKRGEHCHHDCILDEQLGLTCRLCPVVCTEAKDIFPPMVASKQRSNYHFPLYFTGDPLLTGFIFSFFAVHW